MIIVLVITDWKWPWSQPVSYGWYHIVWLIIMIAVSVILCLTLAKKHDKAIDNKVIFIFGVLLVAIELYKQIFFTLDEGHYQWYAFPFQFCSVPMYFAFIAPLIKKEKIQDAMYKFIAIYGLLAGLAVMAYPGTCFHTDYVTILLHTMIWHASMVIMGIYLIVSRRYCSNIKDITKEVMPATIIFSGLVIFALLVNIIGYKLYFGTDKNIYNDTLYLMYISPYYSNPFPILGAIKEKVPYVVFFLLYLACFAVGISVLWLGIFGIRKLTSLINNKPKKEIINN